MFSPRQSLLRIHDSHQHRLLIVKVKFDQQKQWGWSVGFPFGTVPFEMMEEVGGQNVHLMLVCPLSDFRQPNYFTIKQSGMTFSLYNFLSLLDSLHSVLLVRPLIFLCRLDTQLVTVMSERVGGARNMHQPCAFVSQLCDWLLVQCFVGRGKRIQK